MASKALSTGHPVSVLRDRDSPPLPRAGPGLVAAQPYCTAPAGPGLFECTKCAGDHRPRRDGARSHRGHNPRASTPPRIEARCTSPRSFCSHGRADAEVGARCWPRCLPLRPRVSTRRAAEAYVGSSRVTDSPAAETGGVGSGQRAWDPPFSFWMLEASGFKSKFSPEPASDEIVMGDVAMPEERSRGDP